MITLKAWKNKLNDVEIKIKFNNIKISDHYAEISYEMGLDQQSILALSNDVDNLISIWESNGQIIVYDNNFHDKPSYPKIKNSNPTNPYDTSHYYEGFYHARSKDNNENDPLFFITLNGEIIKDVHYNEVLILAATSHDILFCKVGMKTQNNKLRNGNNNRSIIKKYHP